MWLIIVFCFFAYIANSMIARVDAAVYDVLLLDCIAFANPRKTHIPHLTAYYAYMYICIYISQYKNNSYWL